MRAVIFNWIGILCLALLVSACQRDGPEIRVGALLPLTGDNASYGVDCRKGMELALAEFNSAEKTPAVLIVEDSRAEPRTAVTAANKLMSIDRVGAIAGDMFSNTTMAVAPIAQQNGIVLVTPTASLEDIVAVGDHIFSIYPSDRYEGSFGAKRVLADSLSAVAVFQQQLQVFSSMGAAFKEEILAHGGTVPVYEEFASGTRDFRNLLQRSRSIPIEAAYIAAYKTEAFALIQQLRELNPGIRIYSQSTLYDPQTLSTLGPLANGILFSAPYFNELSTGPALEKFRTAYRAKFGSDPNVWAAYGYDVLTLLLRGMMEAKRSGEPLHTVIAASTIDGATGQTTFFPDRTANKTMLMFTVEDGQFRVATTP